MLQCVSDPIVLLSEELDGDPGQLRAGHGGAAARDRGAHPCRAARQGLEARQCSCRNIPYEGFSKESDGCPWPVYPQYDPCDVIG